MSPSVIPECGVSPFLLLIQRKSVWHNLLIYMRTAVYSLWGLHPTRNSMEPVPAQSSNMPLIVFEAHN